MSEFDEEICACRALAEGGDFDGVLFNVHDSRCAARLRPLLERCLEEAEATRGKIQIDTDGPVRPVLNDGLIADLRRELRRE